MFMAFYITNITLIYSFASFIPSNTMRNTHIIPFCCFNLAAVSCFQFAIQINIDFFFWQHFDSQSEGVFIVHLLHISAWNGFLSSPLLFNACIYCNNVWWGSKTDLEANIFIVSMAVLEIYCKSTEKKKKSTCEIALVCKNKNKFHILRL